MAQQTPRLPVLGVRARIKDLVFKNRITLIVGKTGCGKSSQVPSMLLDELQGSILCTQPRRLAVVALAKRVAAERNSELGEEVGYRIGQRSVASSKTRILFATAGLLLEELKSRGQACLSGYTCLIFDEGGAQVYALHSSIDIGECIRSMEVTTSQRRKIILATNIAESSITIPDVHYVVDLCCSNEMYWDRRDPYPEPVPTHLLDVLEGGLAECTKLQKECCRIVWASQSQCRQRMGRTGRTCSGTVYRLVTRRIYSKLEKFETPALRLRPLRREVLLLSCAADKAMTKASAVLQRCMDPPDADVVDQALEWLLERQMLQPAAGGRHEATEFGRFLCSMPISLDAALVVARSGDMGLLREAISLSAIMNSSPYPIVQPFGEEWGTFVHRYAGKGVHPGDRAGVLLANLAAFEFWQADYRAKVTARRLLTGELPPFSDECFEVDPRERHWCSEHGLIASSLLNTQQTAEVIWAAIHRFRPRFVSMPENCGMPPHLENGCYHRCPGGAGQPASLEDLEEVIVCTAALPTPSDLHSTGHLQQLRLLLQSVMQETGSFSAFTPPPPSLPGGLVALVPRCRNFFATDGCSFGELCRFAHGKDPIPAYVMHQKSMRDFQKQHSAVPEFEWAWLPMPSQFFEGIQDTDASILVLDEPPFKLVSALSGRTKAQVVGVCARPLIKAEFSQVVQLEKAGGVKLLHDIKPSALHKVQLDQLGWSRLHCVVWNFPQLEDDETAIDANRKTIAAFFASVMLGVLTQRVPGAAWPEVHLTLANDQLVRWDVREAAACACMHLTNSWLFDREQYPCYAAAPRGRSGSLKARNGEDFGSADKYRKAVTYVFRMHCPLAEEAPPPAILQALDLLPFSDDEEGTQDQDDQKASPQSVLPGGAAKPRWKV